jgi:hypothetical protein
MKQNKVIIGSSALVAGVLLVFGGWRMFSNFAQAQNSLAQRDAAKSKLTRLHELNPFPSDENAVVVRADTAAMTAMLDEMLRTMGVGNIPPPPAEEISPPIFIQVLQTTVRRLRAQAPTVNRVGVVPDGFAFGFERYLGAASAMPRSEDVARLAQQLRMTEKLVAEVYAAKVANLRAVRRDEFEAAEPTEEEAGRPKRRDGGGSASRSEVSDSELYTKQHFTLEVSGSRDTLGTLFNRLAALDTFVVITEADLRKRSDDVRSPPAPEAAAAAAAVPGAAASAPATTPAAAAEPPPTAVSTLPPSQRLLSGPEIDPLIDARIELDIYNFITKGG